MLTAGSFRSQLEITIHDYGLGLLKAAGYSPSFPNPLAQPSSWTGRVQRHHGYTHSRLAACEHPAPSVEVEPSSGFCTECQELRLLSGCAQAPSKTVSVEDGALLTGTRTIIWQSEQSHCGLTVVRFGDAVMKSSPYFSAPRLQIVTGIVNSCITQLAWQ
jgi:hypothetical protein